MAVTVTFDGTPATDVVVVSDTEITATTPAGAAGAVDVVVTTSGGAGTLPDGYTYVPPAPTLASVDPATGTTAGGVTITLTGTGFGPDTTVTFGDVDATDVTVVSATELTVTLPPGAAGDVDVTVTGDGGEDTLLNGFEYVDEPVVGVNVPASTPLTVDTQATYATSLTNAGATAEDVTEEIRISNEAGDLVAADVVYETQDADGVTWTTVTWTEDGGDLVATHTFSSLPAGADNASNVRITVTRDTGDLTGTSTYSDASGQLAQATYAFPVTA